MSVGAVKYTTLDLGIDGLNRVVRKWIGDRYKTRPSGWKDWMNDDKEKIFEKEAMTMGGFPDAPLQDEGDTLNLAKTPFGAKVIAQPETHQLGFVITRKDREFNNINKVQKLTKALADAMTRTKNRAASFPFNDAFAGTYNKTADGQPIVSTSHTNLNGETVANRPASDADLTMATLEAGLINISKTTDESGSPMEITAAILKVAPEEEMNAWRLVNSMNYFTGGVPSAADTGVPNHPSIKRLRVVVDYFQTDPDAWFLLPDKGELDNVHMFTNLVLRDKAFIDEWNDDYIYSMDESYIAYVDDWRGIYGSTGA